MAWHVISNQRMLSMGLLKEIDGNIVERKFKNDVHFNEDQCGMNSLTKPRDLKEMAIFV